MQTNQPLPPNQTAGLSQLARRISAWTTNSLLTVMLVVMALGFGREVLHGWHDEGTSRAVAPFGPGDRLGDAAAPHVLEFGQQVWSIRRQEFSGPPGEVPAALRAASRAAIVDARPRGELPDAAEQELLKRLAGQRPVAEQRGQWRLYAWGEGHPVLIGTRVFGAAGRDGNGAAVPRPWTTLDETAYRVVIWGIAVPAGAMCPGSVDAWTLYVFRSGGAEAADGQPEGHIPLPPGGHRLLSIRAAAGGAITAFSADDGDVPRGFYERWFADRGWTVAAPWQKIASGWHARFERQSRVAVLAVDIRLGIDAQGRWSGLLLESQMERGKP
jgi:hypothetical protein